MEHRRDAGLFDEDVGDVLEALPLMPIESDWLSGLAAPIAAERSSSSRPMPFASTVPSWRYQPMLSTPTWVMFPPKQPYRSSSVVRAPARAAARAALKPPGPLPTTRTSVSWTTSTVRAASVIAFISRGQARVGPGSRRLDGEHRRRLDADADAAPGTSPRASEADIWETTSVSSGNVTWARQSEPRKLTAATRASPSSAGTSRTFSGRTSAST
jgi:hypothetical protein